VRGKNRIREIMLEVFKTMWNEAYYDKVKGEVIATNEYFLLGVEQGEVLKDSKVLRQFDFDSLIRKLYETKGR